MGITLHSVVGPGRALAVDVLRRGTEGVSNLGVVGKPQD